MRASPSMVLLAVALITMLALPAHADETTETTQPAILETDQPGGRPGGITTKAVADCVGCYAGWGLWDTGLNIRARRGSYTDEVLSEIHVHGSIIKAWQDSCAGDWRFGEAVENFSKTVLNTAVDQVHDKSYWQGFQNAWGNVGAHRWKDDGATWSVGFNGETDLCKTF